MLARQDISGCTVVHELQSIHHSRYYNATGGHFHSSICCCQALFATGYSSVNPVL